MRIARSLLEHRQDFSLAMWTSDWTYITDPRLIERVPRRNTESYGSRKPGALLNYSTHAVKETIWESLPTFLRLCLPGVFGDDLGVAPAGAPQGYSPWTGTDRAHG